MTGIDVLLAVVGLIILLVLERWYAAWREADRYRRLERLAHRNLERGIR